MSNDDVITVSAAEEVGRPVRLSKCAGRCVQFNKSPLSQFTSRERQRELEEKEKFKKKKKKYRFIDFS